MVSRTVENSGRLETPAITRTARQGVAVGDERRPPTEADGTSGFAYKAIKL